MKDDKKVIKISLGKAIAIFICLALVIFVGINVYANSIGKPNAISAIRALAEKDVENVNEVSENKNTELNVVVEKNEISEETKNTNITNKRNEDVKYPTTLGAIFKYSDSQINSSVSNKTDDIKYVGEPINSNPYKISDDRKSITVNNNTIKFNTEIYHACFYPLGDGGLEMIAVLLKDGTVKYTTDYGKTIKDGPNDIIDIFAINYERKADEYTFGGATILVANQYGALYDLAKYNK